MKKFGRLILGLVLSFGLVFGGLNLNFINTANQKNKVNTYVDAASKKAVTTAGAGISPTATAVAPVTVSSKVVYNPGGLGTTTLFEGSGITATGTVAGENMNFTIFGDANSHNTKITASREEFYLVPNTNNTYIDTGYKPNNDTTLELSFMTPDNFVNYSFGGQHPDVAGCNAVNASGSHHFGGPLLNGSGEIQYLYGPYPANSNEMTASFQWAPGRQYHSILAASGTGSSSQGYAKLSDGVNPDYVYTLDSTTAPSGSTADISGVNFNTLFLFGQNNGNLVNPVKIGISEAKIYSTSNNSNVLRHYIAVPQGSTEYSATPAPSNCMWEAVSRTYVQPVNGSFDFDTFTTTSDSIDLSVFELGEGDTLKVDQEKGEVLLNDLDMITTGTPEQQAIAQRLLDLRTTDNKTMLSNDTGATMKGIIGPIVSYNIVKGATGNAASISSNGQINIQHLNTKITATPSVASTVASWSISNTNPLQEFRIKATSGNDEILVSDILLSNNKLLQYATESTTYNKDLKIYDFDLEIDVVFTSRPTTNVKVTVASEDDKINITDDFMVRIGTNLMPLSSAIAEVTVFTDADIIIEGQFDPLLYEFVSRNVTTGEASSVAGRIVTIDRTPTTTTDIELTYTIQPREYSVQILGKSMANDHITLKAGLANKYTEKVSYNNKDQKSINMSALYTAFYGDKYGTLNPTLFDYNYFYVFSHFECNNVVIPEGSELPILAATITRNQSVIDDGIFTIHAVYQKKNILNIQFEQDSVFKTGNNPDVTASNIDDFTGVIAGINVNEGFLINENESATVILNLDKRYSVASISGDNGKSQIEPTKYPEVLVIALDKSYNITVHLKHRVVKVDFYVEIEDAKSKTLRGAPDYINGGRINGTAADGENYTEISRADATPQTLVADSDALGKFNYRAKGFRIWDPNENAGEGGYVALPGGVLNANADIAGKDFFDYVSNDGKARICLDVIQQHFVDFSTKGFDLIDSTSTTLTYSNAELGSYTVAHLSGEFAEDNGTYWVDYNSKIKIEQTAGRYGKFINFTGLDDDENETGIFFIKNARYVGVNFESTKLAAWILPTIGSGAGLVLLLMILAAFFIIRSKNLKKLKLAREAEIRDMKRKFNVSGEIASLRAGKDQLGNEITNSDIKPTGKK